MKDIKDLKKGDIVSLISITSRKLNKETEIVSIGRKFITVNLRNFKKFDRETLQCVGWMEFSLFPGSLEEYEELKDKEEKKKEILKEFDIIFRKMDFEEVVLVQKFIKDNCSIYKK